jgi:hypothetical protein
MKNPHKDTYPKCWLAATIVALASGASASAQTLLFKYSFDETGASVVNSGTLSSADLTMRNQAGTALDRHTAGGGGVSGLTTDRAFDNSGGFAYRASMSADIAGTDLLQQFTLTGWYYTAALGNSGARILDNASNNAGFYLARSNTGFVELAVGSSGSTAVAQSTTTGFSATGSWVFFAVTYNGSATSNNVHFYSGSISSTSAFNVTRSLNKGTPANDTGVLTVGNRAANDRPLVGFIDDIRLYSGLLDSTQIEAVRAQAIPEPSTYATLASICALGLAALRRRR